MASSTVSSYYRLTKPGIIRGNALVAVAAFIFACEGDFNFSKFLAMVCGTSLVIACACVLNNILDRDIDSKMDRTKERAIVTGDISIKAALVFAVILGFVGLILLGVFTNILTMMIGVAGIILYVAVYGYFKRNSVHGTVVGSISGALPPVAGYTAVSGSIDATAIVLFAILVAWQMPHFYAIAIYRLKDYQNAGLPVLPAKKGIERTKIEILLYIGLFLVFTSALSLLGFAGSLYLIVMIITSAGWLYVGLKGLKNKDSNKWARKMFFISLIALLIWSLMLSLDYYLP